MSCKKTVLILVDGMRADALAACGHPFAQRMCELGASDLATRTVMPSVTLPCHMSLFHSVHPDRHGVTTNIYTPQVRPIDGLVEVLARAGKRCASFYNWEQLRDLSRPGNLDCNFFARMPDGTDEELTVKALEYIKERKPDFLFLYLGVTDEVGHKFGWMTEPYLTAVYGAWDCIEQVCHALEKDYNVIVTADHGGHGRMHGTEEPEDMTIPLIMIGEDIPAGTKIENASIIDIAPTIVAWEGVEPAADWDGKNLFA